MKRCSFRSMLTGLLLLAAASAGAQPVALGQFGWRARLELPPGASVARVSLPGDALLQLQSSDARDVRVFNAAGESVPFAVLPAAIAAETAAPSTRVFPALALNTASASAGTPHGALQVRIDDAGKARSVWVQLGAAAGTASGSAPRSALFATRGVLQPLKALHVQATLPPNTPVQVLVSTSTDLAQWTRVPVRGRLYHFEGEGAPANDTLEFESPLRLEGRYLRLDWEAQVGMAIAAVTGVVAPPAAAPPRLRVPLPTPEAAGQGALEIATGFLTPLVALELTTANANTLLPVRILARNDASQPWRPLADTIVYRLGSGSEEGSNPPVSLGGWSTRRLRIVSTNGANLAAQRIQAEAEFAPVQLVFVATGAGPFDLAFGRPATPPAAVPLETIASALGERKLEELPEARVGAAIRQEPAKGPLFGWPAAATADQPTLLWAVLVAGVLVLSAVAWSLLRQLKAGRPRD
ncbi:MAG: hypothetical protein JWQ33_265 [Ramlibacter sp.]|nr:hypothetical protein [Ramlibacter sp.]